MFTVTRTIPVNPAGEVVLNRDHLWRGLEMKAENPVPFIPTMTACKVIERNGNVLVRDFVSRGEAMTERVTLYPKERVKFERLKSSVMGTILNEIVEDQPGTLELRFTFSMEVEGIAPGSPEEKKFVEEMAVNYLDSANTTLAAVRQMVKDGALAA